MDCNESRVCVLCCVFSFFFFFFSCSKGQWLLFMNNSRTFPTFLSLLSHQWITTLFMAPQISLFSNFFIKNGSYSTIHTFKNYFATVFSVSVTISSIQMDPLCHLEVAQIQFEVGNFLSLGGSRCW